MSNTHGTFLVLLLISFSTLALAAYNVVDYGAKPDGQTDSAKPFLKAWAMACASKQNSIVYVPEGRFFVSQALFTGPCNSKAIRIMIKGTIIASSGYDSSIKWLHFKNVQGLSIFGGILDARGQSLWACKLAHKSCPTGSISLTVSVSKNVLISGLTSLNSKLDHISIQSSSGVTVRNAKIIAPSNSPNTDGIHVLMSSGVTITGSIIQTGDDCIAMKPGARNIWIEHVKCGPGHGISIGSLGGDTIEAGVQNITVSSVVFSGTQNGLRIKTYGNPSTGFVKGVIFQHAIMNNVQNPIIIDQNYCPNNICPKQNSGVQISGVSFSDIQGSSATKVAMKLDCSGSNPCSGIRLQNIKLTYGKVGAQSFCRNANGKTIGVVIPKSCL